MGLGQAVRKHKEDHHQTATSRQPHFHFSLWCGSPDIPLALTMLLLGLWQANTRLVRAGWVVGGLYSVMTAADRTSAASL